MGSASISTQSPPTPRFAARREQILDVGSRLINEGGLKGLTLGAVSEEIGLGGSSVTYYFRRKELLAIACYDRALDVLEDQVARAAEADSPSERIERFLHLVTSQIKEDSANQRHLAQVLELRGMDDPYRTALIKRYFAIFASVRSFFGRAPDEEGRVLQFMRAQIILEVAHMLPGWLEAYVAQDHPRVVRRVVELLTDGWAPSDTVEMPPAVLHETGEPDQGPDKFLGAAMRLINERGYRGASVDRIAAALKVTKGSFYHHLDAKDDLVLACFRRSLATIEKAQDAALESGGTFREKLSNLLASLTAVQLGNGTPLLRAAAFPVMPPELRREAMESYERIVRRFSGMIADGISERSIFPVDPRLAGEVIMSGLNAALELREMSRTIGTARAVSLYTGLLTSGLV